ncbi:methyl-accepting chemotaxis protein [Peteryoungia aggregata LMG 23059]|uniref:Methyl-accepting chemotaxis protein n=2 Tax=Peteryoungia aggregata TaxID=34013 RepID=A0ABU0GD44_9HYPH|nr:methyl-accepting chemotaxis protein [Peteryoungia aggregata LMG 23059]
MSALSRLSFRKSLTLLALVPLCAVLGLGAMIGINAYGDYKKLQEAQVLADLAHAGGELMVLMPLETGPNKAEIRTRADATYARTIETLNALEALGYNDPITKKLRGDLEATYARMPEYRQKLDAGDKDPILPLRYAQPTASAALALTLRSANLTDNVELSSNIRGHQALMKVNEGYLAINRMGQFYISNGGFGKPEVFRFSSLINQIRSFDGPFREHARPEIVARYDAFFDTPDGKVVADLIKRMESLEDYAGPAEGLQQWIDVMTKRREYVTAIIQDNAAYLLSSIDSRVTEARQHLLTVLGALALFVAAVIGVAMAVSRTLAGSIRRVGASMVDLARGETQNSIPFTDRSDEIGEMARSVEVFREAAIRNAELEAEASQNRVRAERERAEMQARAEADAEERLTRATGTLAAGLKRLASGDMMCEIDEQFAPQFEALRHDFNTSVQQLRSVLVSVGGSAHAVSGGSGEISHASDDLAKRTEQQAASLEETAAALEEITSNVTATSRRTGEARDIVRTTRSRAEQSGVVVGNAVTAMERIEHASKQISQIIGVIDEIAFQTNLLALNAGVEAARAGEAGKGFAVVAQEVRELAQRSANAAKEIKALIGNSEVAVSEGVKLVNETGDGLTAIAGLVQAINEHMDAIASAAQEQSVGLGEVNQAVNHMDQATQKNAAMVEEMNAASAGLAQEAASLAELLRQFQTGQESSAPSRGMSARTPAPARAQASAPVSPAAPRRSMPAVSGNTALARDNWEEF